MTDDASEIASLEKVLYRLGMTDDDKLEDILSKLLCRLLSRLGSSEAIRNKTMQVLQHINKRVLGNPSIKLPLVDVIDLTYKSNNNSVFTVNFALMYVELGVDRLSVGERSKIVPLLICGISQLSESQQLIILRALYCALPSVSVSGDMSKWLPKDTSEEDKEFILKCFTDVLLLVPSTITTPPGLTPSLVNRLKRKDGTIPDGAYISLLQGAVVKILLAGVFTHESVLPLLILGKCAFRHDVVDAAEQGIGRVMKIVDTESESLCLDLLGLIDETRSFRTSFSPGVREIAMSTLLKLDDIAVAKVTQPATRVAQICLMGSSSSMRVLALELIKRITRVSDEDALQDKRVELSKIVLDRVAKATPGAFSDTERERTYSCLSLLISKFPSLFAGNSHLVLALMKLLDNDAPMRMVVQEALGVLCDAFVGSSSLVEIQTIMKAYMNHTEPKVRLVVADWTRRLFPFDDSQSRYISLVMACDSDVRVRQVASKGLVASGCTSMSSVDDKLKGNLKVLEECASVEAGRLALVWTDETSFPEEYSIVTDEENMSLSPATHSWLLYLSELDLNRPSSSRSTEITRQFQLSSLLGFSLACLKRSWTRGESFDPSELVLFQNLVENSMELDDLTAMRCLHRVASKCLVELFRNNDTVSATIISESWLLRWLAADSLVVRENVAQILGFTPKLHQSTDFLDEIVHNMNRKVPSAINARHGAILASSCLLIGKQLPAKYRTDISISLVNIMLETSKVRLIASACITALGDAALHCGLSLPDPGLEEMIVTKLCTSIAIDTSKDSDESHEVTNAKLIKSLATTLGHICASDVFSSESQKKVLDALFEAGNQKDPEFQVMVGKSLSHIVSCSSHATVVVFNRVLNESSKSTKNRIRNASSLWLLVVVAELGGLPKLDPFVERINEAFASLLREKHMVTRESAARGMAILYHKSEKHRLELSSSLARLLSGKSEYFSLLAKEAEKERVKEAAIKAGETVEVAVGKEEDLTMSTLPLNVVYKEIYVVATRVSKPSLTFHLLYLSASDPLWHLSSTKSLRCQAYDKDAGKQLDSETVEQLIPILFHYKFDDEDSIRIAVSKLWESMISKTEKEIIDEHLMSLIDELMRNASSRHVRERKAGAMALARVVRDTSADKLIDHLERMWLLSSRLIDDVQDATKLAAISLASAMTTLVVRCCDAESKVLTHAQIQKSLEIVVPFMLEKGLLNQSKDAQSLSVVTLSKVVNVAKKLIRPFISQIVSKLVESMSPLEDQTFQYAMFHTNDQGGEIKVSSDELENLRVQAANSSPMQHTIDKCLDQLNAADDSISAMLFPVLGRLARSGVGLLTLACVSRTINRLCSNKGLATQVQVHAHLLLRGLAVGLSDSSSLIRDSFASTAASVCRLATPSDCKEYLKTVISLYDNPGDAKSRLTSSVALRLLLGASPASFPQAVGICFFARHDNEDEDVSDAWKQAWSENVGSVEAGAIKYGVELVSFGMLRLESTVWLHKWQAAKGLQDIAATNAAVFDETAVLNKLASLLPGRYWEGKNAVVETISQIWMRNQCIPIGRLCLDILALQPGTNDSYEASVLEALGQACAVAKDAKAVQDQCIPALFNNLKLARGLKSTCSGFEALGKAWNSDTTFSTDLYELASVKLKGAEPVLSVSIMNCLRNVLSCIPLQQASPFLDLSWKCVVENKLPSIIIQSLKSIQGFYDRGDLTKDLDSTKSLAASALIRVEPLLLHRDHTIIHAASCLRDSAKKYA